ncbi:MAG: helix-turn-helix domain-containing protein, partial [Methylococcales bacterium]|nr:helix-turn-helix domain-containing protein [Methylococcales bacterium]
MSFDTMKWAFNQSPNKPPHKHLLLILAYRADANNQCYPSISCLIRDTGMGRRTIQEHLRELLAQGFIKIIERIGSSNIYTLINKPEKEIDADNSAPLSQHPSKKTADLPCETCIQNKSLKTSLSKEKNKDAKTAPYIDAVDDLSPAMKAAHDWA